MRTIDRLRYEFGVPLEYDESNRGYFLTDPNFSFATIPLGRDELVSLVILRELAFAVDDIYLHNAIESLWVRSVNGRGDLSGDLCRMRERFSSSWSSVGRLPQVNMVHLLAVCHRRQLVVVTYDSPWSDTGPQEYGGVFERIHLRDGLPLALFHKADGGKVVFNLSFVLSIQETTQVPARLFNSPQDGWQEPFCHQSSTTWDGSQSDLVEIRIRPPGSRFYAAQRWHEEQEDTWDGDVLVRRFPGGPSLETIQRVLSLGRSILSVKPSSITELIKEDLRNLMRLAGDISVS